MGKTFGHIQTQEIVITNERIEHIKDRHPKDYALFIQYGVDSVTNPDIVIKDEKHEGTIFMIKRLPDTNLNTIVKIILGKNETKKKNSIMTFYRIRERNLKKLMNKNDVLYKKE